MCVSLCVHYCTDKVKCSMWVVLAIGRSVGQMESTVLAETFSTFPAGKVKAAQICKEKDNFKLGNNTPSAVFKHMWRWTEHLDTLSSSITRAASLPLKHGLDSGSFQLNGRYRGRSGLRLPAVHKITPEPYVSQMLLAWAPFKETIKHNYRNI